MNVPRRSLVFFAFVLSAPVFFEVSGTIRLASSYTSDSVGAVILPLSYLLMPLMFLREIAHRTPRTYWFAAVIGALLIGTFFLGYFWGVVSGATASSTFRSTARFLQSAFPIISFFLALHFFGRIHDQESRIESLVYFFRVYVRFLAFFLMLYAFQTLISGSSFRFILFADHIGPFYNPKITRFFPTLLALSSVFCIACFLIDTTSKNGSRVFDLLLGIVLALGFMTFWSRTALFAFVVGMLSVFIYTRTARANVFIGTFGLVAVVLFSAFAYSVELTGFTSLQRSLETITYLFSTSGVQNYGDVVRQSRIWFAVGEMFATPFGSGFATHNQYLFPVDDIAIAENGFLDVGVRGGPIAVVLFVWLIMRGGRRTHLAARRTDASMGAVSCLFIATVFGALIWLHLASEAYFSLLFWFLIGATNSLPLEQRQLGRTYVKRSASPSETGRARLQTTAPVGRVGQRP